MKRRIAKLGVFGIGLFLVLGGPTPGFVGDCTSEGTSADPVEHCQRKQAWTCARRRARGDLGSDAEQSACLDLVGAMCRPANWPVGCVPTQLQSNACIEAMMNSATLGNRGECFPDGLSCGTPPMLGPGCSACDQPSACNLCGAATGPLTTDDAGAEESTDDAGAEE